MKQIDKSSSTWFWGQGESLNDLKAQMEIAAANNSNILIIGETGTGKEFVAEQIHLMRIRNFGFNQIDAPFVTVNSGAIPENLVESILFGHERGAFTSARERQIGKFELARQGSIFLDEIQNLPLSCQTKLLRVLQYKNIERLGAKENIRAKCLVIAASNIPLELLVSEGKFRRDLYYRLNIFPIYVPNLKCRKEDLPAITSSFLKRICKEHRIEKMGISPRVEQLFKDYSWPGNLRELEHALLYASLRAKGEITQQDLPWTLSGKMNDFIQNGEWKI